MINYLNDELSLEEGFQLFIKECFINEDEHTIDKDEESNKKKFKEKASLVINKLKKANTEIKQKPDTPLSLNVKTALRFVGYFTVAYGGLFLLTSINPLAGLLISGAAVATAKIGDPKIREYQCNKAYHFYKKEIEWLDNKLDNTDDPMERKNISSLLSSYKANLDMLSKNMDNKSSKEDD